jgi:mono/diheme cytochrome c family protein
LQNPEGLVTVEFPISSFRISTADTPARRRYRARETRPGLVFLGVIICTARVLSMREATMSVRSIGLGRVFFAVALFTSVCAACHARPDEEGTQRAQAASLPAPFAPLSPPTTSPPPQPSPAVDPALLERGRYFANAIVDCKSCHTRRSDVDQTQALSPEWTGGEVFDRRWNLPGALITPNLTPDRETGLGAWTDDEVRRAVRQGLNRAGEPLFPLMPAHLYQSMADADLTALIAFLRSLPPQKKPTERVTQLDMPRSALPRLPELAGPVAAPPTEDPVARGKYIVTLANCITCHSPTAKGKLLEGRFLAGGVAFTTPFGSFVSPNITSDPDTGIGRHSDADLVRLFREGTLRNGKQVFANFMPWYVYRNMTDADIAAVIAFLRSAPAINNDTHLAENQFPLGG